MSLRFTPAVMAVCRWQVPRYAQAPMGFKLQSISVRHIRWSSSSNQSAHASKTPRDHTVATSLDQGLELRGIRMQVSRDGGRNALGILKNLEVSDGNRMVLKGVICLQEYHDRISILSVKEAEKVIAADDAGRIVHDWAWIGYPNNSMPKTILEKEPFRIQSLWKSKTMWFSTTALISWHPRGLADEGYDFFSRKFDEFWCQENFDKFSDYIWIHVINVLEKGYIAKKHAVSSRSFERCANRIIVYWRLRFPYRQTMQTGFMALDHPNRPSADQFLAALVEIDRDRDHPLRSYTHRCSSNSRSAKNAYARFLWSTGIRASIMLNAERRLEEGALVLKIVYEIWGRDSEFLNPSYNLYQERLERWKRQNQEIMRNLHPRFYVPFEF
ncbi:hypothetical protein F4680DRAFT_451164 [Xylaria scruposa]|nr:hypothetical protein F4680DRAFT_451164 [Xylaria scruposa]